MFLTLTIGSRPQFLDAVGQSDRVSNPGICDGYADSCSQWTGLKLARELRPRVCARPSRVLADAQLRRMNVCSPASGNGLFFDRCHALRSALLLPRWFCGPAQKATTVDPVTD